MSHTRRSGSAATTPAPFRLQPANRRMAPPFEDAARVRNAGLHHQQVVEIPEQVLFCMREGLTMVDTDETGKTTFRFRHVTEGTIFVVGDFCRWQTDHLPMHRVAPAEWALMLRLPPGAYEFRYVAAGRWYTDYAAFGVNRNTFHDFNSVLWVPKVRPIAREPVRMHQATSECLAAPAGAPAANRRARRQSDSGGVSRKTTLQPLQEGAVMNGALQLEVMPGPVGATTTEDRRAAETRRLVDLIHQMPDIRVDKVRRMRHLAVRGGLETPNRIDGTVRRLLEEFSRQAGAAN